MSERQLVEVAEGDEAEVVRADGHDLFDDYTRSVMAEMTTHEELTTVAGCGFALARIARESMRLNGASGKFAKASGERRMRALSAIKQWVKQHRGALGRTDDAEQPFGKLFMCEAKRFLSDETYGLILAAAHARRAESARRREVIISSVGSALPMSGNSGGMKVRV